MADGLPGQSTGAILCYAQVLGAREVGVSQALSMELIAFSCPRRYAALLVGTAVLGIKDMERQVGD